jgi:wyosine [tRNA(Phe)-imidazoG37] synthetase (radical SAM superfamily)
MDPVVDHGFRSRSDTPACRRMPPGFAGSRDFLGNRFVYLVLSARAHGLTVGIDLTPDRRCNFDCIYCEVLRQKTPRNGHLNVDAMAAELERTLQQVQQGHVRDLPGFRDLPSELLQLRHVALSGEGEPTLSPCFAEAVQAVVHVRARGHFPFFKIVLFSNASLLDQPQVQHGLRFLIPQDELWLKLDAGSEEHFQRINRPQVPFSRVRQNILMIGRQRPVVIQTLFPQLEGREPAESEIDTYAVQLRSLKAEGAQISLVQIYSATRPTSRSECRHLPLKTLSRIAQQVRATTGLTVEVY